MKSDERVKEWIESTFEDVEVKPFPILPAGRIVRDRNGDEILAYYDMLTDSVKYFERPKPKKKAAK